MEPFPSRTITDTELLFNLMKIHEYCVLPAKITRSQVNVENLFDRKYCVNAGSNTNITPGFPRIGERAVHEVHETLTYGLTHRAKAIHRVTS